MATLKINDQTPRSEYTAAAAQVLFSVPFEFFADADLTVYEDSVLQVLDTDYTVIGAGVAGGGSITFTVAMTGGEKVSVLRDLALARDVKYAQSGALPFDVLDTDFAKIVAMMQQLERDLLRAIPLAVSDPTISMELPVAASRASKFLIFGAAGELLVSASIPDSVVFNQATIGANLWLETGAETAAGVTPTFFYYEPYDVRRYGATLDGTVDDAGVLELVKTLDLVFPEGSARIETSVTFTGQCTFNNGALIKPIGAAVWARFNDNVDVPDETILDAASTGNIIIRENPQYSYQALTLKVVAAPSADDEFSTVQAAIDAVPRYISHLIEITIVDATYAETPKIYDKNLIASSDTADFFVTGNTTTPANVIIQGMAIRDCTGFLCPKLRGIQFSGGLGGTSGNEAVVIATGVQSMSIDTFIIDGVGLGASPPASTGILATGASQISLVNFQDAKNLGSSTKTKHRGIIWNTDIAISSSTGLDFHRSTSSGITAELKGVGPNDAADSPCTDATNVDKALVENLNFDQYLGFVAGPSWFLSSTTTIEDYFTSLDGYNTAHSGGGAASIGIDGVNAITGGGTFDLRLTRTNLLASNDLQRPIFMLITIDITTLPVGETVYVGNGAPVSGGGDFIGFKIISTKIDGVVRLSGSEVATTVLTAAISGVYRLGFLYSPGSSDTKVEASSTHYTTFFRNDGNTGFTQTMAGALSDATTLKRVFALYCAEVASAVDVNVLGYKYVKA